MNALNIIITAILLLRLSVHREFLKSVFGDRLIHLYGYNFSVYLV